MNINVHQQGTITVTASTIKGQATSDFGGSASGNGQSVSFGLSTAALIDLTYQTAPSSCVWTERPQGATGAGFADAGVKIVWTGCEAFTVAHST